MSPEQFTALLMFYIFSCTTSPPLLYSGDSNALNMHNIEFETFKLCRLIITQWLSIKGTSIAVMT